MMNVEKAIKEGLEDVVYLLDVATDVKYWKLVNGHMEFYTGDSEYDQFPILMDLLEKKGVDSRTAELMISGGCIFGPWYECPDEDDFKEQFPEQYEAVLKALSE